MEKSREMFDEGMDIIVRAWTEEKINHKGEFWSFVDEVEILPKPVQDPHPPIYIAALSPPSFFEAATTGWNIQLASPFSYRMYREQWIDTVRDNLIVYESKCVELGRDPKKAERAILLPFYVAPTEEQAVAEFGPHAEWFYSKVSGHERISGRESEVVKGYEVAMSESLRTQQLGMLNFSSLHANSAVVASDPAGCIEKLKHLKAELGITEFILWFNLGGMDADRAMASMRLAMAEVLRYV
jgi:alkanesulfonate monooxygenase SsuD/methylene tetrahydromethanopterin reductase-like flavin-dependent oxidoreductase (luciferase family)